jgi:hypothetical protein
MPAAGIVSAITSETAATKQGGLEEGCASENTKRAEFSTPFVFSISLVIKSDGGALICMTDFS